MHRRPWTCAAIAACSLTLGGCELLDEIALEPSANEQPLNASDGSLAGGPGGGAAYGVPSGAQRVARGNGRVNFRVPSDGRIWVTNETRGYRIVSRTVKRGDRIEVIPESDKVERNDQPIYQQNLERRDEHGIYFSTGSGGADPYGSIDRSAENVLSRTGRFSWRAEENGEIWIGDDKLERVLVNQKVRRGDLVELILGDADQIKVNGSVVYSQNLESKHPHSVFFK